jgi:large exoprotein involved in heme utilization and adhesion
VASPGEVGFSPLELAPDLQVDSFTHLGQIAISQRANVTVSSPPEVAVRSRPGAGTVLIRGGRLVVDNAFVNARTTGAGDSARLGIDVRLAEDLVLRNGGQLIALSSGAGDAGDVRITAMGSVTILDRASGIFSSASGSRDAGHIAISTPNLIIKGGLLATATMSAGRAGDIMLDVGRLTLTDDARIGSVTGGTGRGGTVQVTATDSVAISGRASDDLPNRSGFNSSTVGRGEAGGVTISAPTVTVDGGAILAGTLGDSRGGDIVVTVGRLTLTGGALITGTSCCAGPGGTVTVTATDSVVISGRSSDGTPSHLSSSALGRGDAGRVALFAPTVILDGGTIETSTRRDGRAGDIVLEVGRLTLTGGAFIDSSTSGAGPGGTVTIAATESIVIAGSGREGFPSGLFSVTQGRGPGGNLRLAAPRLQLRDAGTISASSTGDGAAGMLVLDIGETFRSQGGRVTTAAARAGGAGSNSMPGG